MATPFDLRYLSSNPENPASPRSVAASEPPTATPKNYALSQRGASRHPVGLAGVVGLHLLLAAAMLTARLHAGPPPVLQAALTTIDVPPSPPPKPQTLPDAPHTPVHPLVAPMPAVVVDQPEPIQAAPLAAAPAAPGPTAPGPATGSDTGSTLPRVATHDVHINAADPSCRPVYPHIAEREGVTGITKLRFTVDSTGHVTAQLLQASGPLRQNRRMDQAAIDALSTCPVTVGNDEFGQPVGGTVDVNYKWTIW